MAAYVVSCYSYKGGTGRTTGSANLAYGLAALGRRVCLIDLDIEAPGLQNVLCIDDSDIRYYVQHALSARLDTGKYEHCAEIALDVAPQLKYGLPDGAEFRFIPASPDPKDSVLVKWKGRQPLSLLRSLLGGITAIHKTEIFVLDIASGLRNSSIVPIAASNLIVIFFRWSRQHLQGTLNSLRWLQWRAP